MTKGVFIRITYGNFEVSGMLKNILCKQLISFSKCVAFLYQK